MAEALIQQVDVKAALAQGADETASDVVQIETARALEIVLAKRNADARHPEIPIDGSGAGRRREHAIARCAAWRPFRQNGERRLRQRQAVSLSAFHALGANGDPLLVEIDLGPKQALAFFTLNGTSSRKRIIVRT